MPKLSLCILARNEEANLPRAIRSFEGVADEVVVADTGSTDGTKAVAQDLGAKVYEYPWRDDFAAVRNFVFGKATGEWIFHLDADEELRPESKGAVLALLDQTDIQGALVLREDIAERSQPEVFSEMWQLRVFRTEGLPEQVGRCHPHFVPRLEEVAQARQRKIVTTSIRLRHWGYVAEVRREKLLRGAKLLRLELEDRPGQLYYLSELVRTLYQLQDPAAYETLCEAAALLSEQTEPGVSALGILEAMLQLPEAELPDGWSADRLRRYVLEWFPTSIPLRWHLARLAFIRSEFADARDQLMAISDLVQSGSFDKTLSFNPQILGDELRLNLGVCQFRLGDLDGAEASFARISSDSAFAAAATQNLAAIRDLRSQFS